MRLLSPDRSRTLKVPWTLSIENMIAHTNIKMSLQKVTDCLNEIVDPLIDSSLLAVKDVGTVVKRASPQGEQGEAMLKEMSIALKRVVSRAPVEDADAAAPYSLPCNTPEFYNNDEDIDCEEAKE